MTAACGTGGHASSESPAPGAEATRPAAALLAPTPGVEPVRFPEDEAPHDTLTEWWYYTGHLFTPDGARYGFEYVIFQAQRGAFPPYYASHFAITDNASDTFRFAEKSGPDAERPVDQGFSLALDDWTMTGALGNDRITAAMDDYAIDLELTATKPPVLHNGIGYVDFGPSGGSYYYSRTRMEVDGALMVDGQRLPVTGEAWFDHQWGNFITVSFGWDWFAVQMENGEDLTISLVHDGQGNVEKSYGTLIDDAGRAVHLEADDFVVTTTDEWTSPHTGVTWPSGWTIALPDEGWEIALTPSMRDQELRTTASTGVIYWEGEVEIAGTIDGQPAGGLGYVELTGYASPDDAP